jgi:hypothetical protein
MTAIKPITVPPVKTIPKILPIIIKIHNGILIIILHKSKNKNARLFITLLAIVD